MAEVSRNGAKALRFETEIRSFEMSVLFASSRAKLFLSPRSRAKTL